MLAHPIATAAFLLVGSAAAASDAATTPKEKMEFMRAMNGRHRNNRGRRLSAEDQKDFKAALYGNSKQSSTLREKFISKAKHVKAGEGRKLQNYNNNNNGKDGTDDYYAATGEWNNGFGFDPTQYSLSYHRCAAVRQFDDALAATEDADSVFATKRFAVFRFCPESTCMGFVEEYECGCETQCENIAAAAAKQYGNSNNGGDDDGQCEEACQTQCVAYSKYQTYGAADANGSGMYEEGAANNDYDTQDASAKYQTVTGTYGRQYTFNMNYAREQQAEEDGELLGARGDGCQSNYGEYMMEIDEYLNLMLEYQEERFETYCEYCEECMYNVYQVWLQNGGNYNRKLKFEEFKNSEEHQKMIRELGGNTDGGQANPKFYNVCPEYDTCAEYTNYCEKEMDAGYSQYFECTEVERNNGQVAYIGPHCASDGFTITLGVYADEYCNEYIGNSVGIANYIGEEMNIEDDALKSYYNSANGVFDMLTYSNEDDVCIPCRKADNPYEQSDYVANNDDQNQAQQNYGETDINEICENLYLVSARCDKHFRSYNNKAKQAKYAEAIAQEDLTCDFIDSVVIGNYNEMGFVDLGDNYSVEKQTGWLKDNMYAQQYGHYIAEVTPFQIFGLIFSILAVTIFAVWSATLHKSLSKRGPWRPRRGLNSVEPDRAAEINRQNSGIVMGRSQSNASYYMT